MPVTLHNVVARAAAASFCEPKFPTNLKDINHGTLYSNIPAMLGILVLDCWCSSLRIRHDEDDDVRRDIMDETEQSGTKTPRSALYFLYALQCMHCSQSKLGSKAEAQKAIFTLYLVRWREKKNEKWSF